MRRMTPRIGFLTCCLALAGIQAQADPSDAKRWSKVENISGKTYIITNTDVSSKSTIGTLWCRKQGVTGNGKKITVKGDSYTLDAGSHEFYFDTTATRIGMHLKLQDSVSNQSINLHVSNLDPTVTGTEIQVSGKPLNTCNLIIDPTGYRNRAGGVLFTLKPVAGAAAATDE